MRHVTEEGLNPPARYDMQTLHAHIFGSPKLYQYSAREIIQAIRAYAQSEPIAALFSVRREILHCLIFGMGACLKQAMAPQRFCALVVQVRSRA